MTRTAHLTVTVLIAGWASSLPADVIYNDFFTGTYMGNMYTNAFNAGSGETVSGISPSLMFSPSVNEALSEVDFVTSMGQSTDTNSIVISVSTVPGNAPGPTLLESHEFDGAMGLLSASQPPPIIVWHPATEIDLVAGDTYWITLSAPGTDIVWNDNEETMFGNPPQFGDDQLVSGSWQPTDGTLGAIEIQGGAESGSNPSPEPGTVLLLGTGIMAVVSLRRGRKARG